MARPKFTPRYEESETAIRTRVLGNLPEGWRKEPGDFTYDVLAPSPLEVKQLQANQDEILKHAFAQFAEDEFLDLKLSEVGLTRGQETANKRRLEVQADAGVIIPKGYNLLTVILDQDGNPLQYTVDEALTFGASSTQDLFITCKTKGEIGNAPNGSEFILQPPIPGVRIISDAGTTIPGADRESNESAWHRYDFKVKHPDTGGNRNDYIRWAQDVTGVGKAKCIPLWQGGGTVKVVIVDTTYNPASDFLTEEVQEYLDPGITGLGDGKAPCGAFVTVKKADPVAINIEATVEWSDGTDVEAATAAFIAEVEKYRRGLVFANKTSDNPPVIRNKIGALLSFTEGVSNYSGLTINGGTIDVPIGAEEVPTLGTVNLWTA